MSGRYSQPKQYGLNRKKQTIRNRYIYMFVKKGGKNTIKHKLYVDFPCCLITKTM